jgi:hypothetical protein
MSKQMQGKKEENWVCEVAHVAPEVVCACFQFQEQNKLYLNTVRFIFIPQGVENIKQQEG